MRSLTVFSIAFLIAVPFSASHILLADELPTNQWTQLPDKPETGYQQSAMIYVPSRHQLLHWGAIGTYGRDVQGRNDLRALDLTAGSWVSDYPSDPGMSYGFTGGGSGNSLSYQGSGKMLESGNPHSAVIVHGVCYDSKRDQLIYTMAGLMAAYNPKTKVWRDLNAKTIIYGKEYPGGPPLYGVGTCYDPINDEIVMFPHFSGALGPRNEELLDATGQVSSHLGTLRYRFADNTWRRATDTMGSSEVRNKRAEIVKQMSELSQRLDSLYARDRHNKSADVIAELRTGGDKLRRLKMTLDGPLRVEPPPRGGAGMVYHDKLKSIVMVGGRSGLVRTDLDDPQARNRHSYALNDTWLYDCTTRQWRALNCKNRPPQADWTDPLYDPDTGLILLVTQEQPYGKPLTIKIWSLDITKAEWKLRHSHTSSMKRSAFSAVGFDPQRRLLVMTRESQYRYAQNIQGQETWLFPLDLNTLQSEPAPAFETPPAIQPMRVPADNSDWLNKLAALPANQWTHTHPARETPTRDWGTLAVDPVRGWVVYFGGGHSTYQVNDVAIYQPGANQWVHNSGRHNDNIPAVSWGGAMMGYDGGPPARHQRSTYVAVDGRLYYWTGTSRYPTRYMQERRLGFAWFCDMDRGGVWRMVQTKSLENRDKLDPPYGHIHLATDDGRILGLGGEPAGYYSKEYKHRIFNSYNVYDNQGLIREVPAPFPQRYPESRPFCYLTGQNKVLWIESRENKDKQEVRKLWVYDIPTNRFKQLRGKNQPSGLPATVVYVPDQNGALAIFHDKSKNPRQWVYSFQHDAWAELPLQSDNPMGFQRPYAQMVYVPKYKLLVNVGKPARGTSVMRPDFSRLEW